MTGKTDLILAFAAATAVHAGALSYGLPTSGGGGGGDAGQDRITIAAASPALAAMLSDWDRTPEIADTAAMPPPPETATSPIPPDAQTSPTRLPDMPPLAGLPSVPDPIRLATIAPAAPSVPDAAPPLDNALSQRETPPTRPATPDLSRPTLPQPQIAADTPPPAPNEAPQLATRPLERPAPLPSPAVTRRIATGLGETGTRGDARTAAPAPSKAGSEAATAAWAAAIQRQIARHHRYPRDARTDGRVRVAMVILPGGQLDRVTVAQSSGVAALDRAALDAVRRAAPFPPAPQGIDEKWFSVGQWITFRK